MKNKFLVSLLLALTAFQPFARADYETGPANTVLRVPSGGGKAKYGSIDLAQSAAVGSTLLSTANGGWGQSIAASTGVPSLSAGTLTFNTTLTKSLGGWGQSIAASTGVPSFSSGTLTFNTTLTTALGGLGGNFGSSTGALSIASGTVTAGTLSIANGGTGGTSLTSGGTSGSSSPALSSGTYTPTISSITGTFSNGGSSASVPAAWKWHRVGNMVAVSGFFNVGPTGNGVGTFTATLPTTTANFSGTYDAGGSMAAINLNWGGCILSNNGAQTVKFQGQPNAVNSTDVGFNFQYEVK